MTFPELMKFFHNRYTNPNVSLESIRIKTSDSVLLSMFTIESYAVIEAEPLIYDVTLLTNIQTFLDNLDEEKKSEHIIGCVLRVDTSVINRNVVDEFLLLDCVGFIDDVLINTEDKKNAISITIDFQILITNLEFENFAKDLLPLL